MSNVILVGTQWGDEGKGKIVDFLSEHADLVVRFQGGSNAGHTIVVGKQKLVLHVVPSGILQGDTVCVVGNGVVLDVDQLKRELDELREAGYEVSPENLKISENAHLILPHHVQFDRLSEEGKGGKKVGTTGRGIGPTYVDKVAREGIRVGDLLSKKWFRSKLEEVLKFKNAILEKVYGEKPIDLEPIVAHYEAHRKWLAPHICNCSVVVHEAHRAGKRVLFEGAQGTSLDVDHGTYPYVTSSNTVAGAACVGAGIGPTQINRVIGVSKAYTTRVGEGPSPTQLDDETGARLRKVGEEFGATTGRPRRCGWLDAVVLRHAVRVNGVTDLAITKLDVLTGFETIKIATGYRQEGKVSDRWIGDFRLLGRAEPVYEEHPGWSELPDPCRRWEDLPANAIKFLNRISELAETPVSIVSTGPERDERIVVREVF